MKHLKSFESYSDEMKDWQERYDQVTMDMEEEAQPEGGEVSNEYGQMLQDLEDEKDQIMNKYKKPPRREMTYADAMAIKNKKR